MFFPIRTDRPLKTIPWVNYALIAVNVLIHVFITLPQANGTALAPWYLMPNNAGLTQFFSYQFLHLNWMHLISNMVFLYVFGNAMEDRLGRVGYLAFYLAAGVLAGWAHCMTSTAPVLGASGAVAGVTGAFLALFPRTDVTIVYFFFFIGAFEVSSMLLILFQIGQDLFFNFVSGRTVAYEAHLAGYLFGFIVGMSLLMSRLIAREPYDMLSLIERWKRRREFKSITGKGYTPWEGNKPGDPPRADEPTPEVSEQQKKVMELRARIGKHLADHDHDPAAELYTDLLHLDPRQVLSQQNQLDVANQLMARGQYDQAATAYELFLNTYTKYAQREQVQLILGLIYARYLERKQRAKELLAAALPRLSDPEQKKLARGVLDKIG